MRARKGSGSFLNGRSREKWRSKRQKQNKGIAKAGCHPKMVAPRLFAFIWISSFSVVLLAWRSVCASLRCGNRCFRNGQRKQIIRTRLLLETSSDYIGLVPVTGLEPVRCRQRWILSPLRLPIPSHRQIGEATICIIPYRSPFFKRFQGKNLSLMPITNSAITIRGRM